MNYQSQFTPEEIQRLVAGETVSKSTKAGEQPSAKKAAPADPSSAATVTRPQVSIPINDRVEVSRPNIKDKSGKRISSDSVVNISSGTLDRIDQDRRDAESRLIAEAEASQELRKIASNEQLLNQLNGLRRIVEKQQKELTALKKQQKGDN